MYVGQPLPRPEDFRFLTGCGNFVDDIKPQNCVYLAFSAARTRMPRSYASMPSRRLRAQAAPNCDGGGLGKGRPRQTRLRDRCVHRQPSDARGVRPCWHPVRCITWATLSPRWWLKRAIGVGRARSGRGQYKPLPAVAKTGSALDNKAPSFTNNSVPIDQRDHTRRQNCDCSRFCKGDAHGRITDEQSRCGKSVEAAAMWRITRRRPINVHCGQRRRCRICCGGESANTRYSSPNTSCASSLRMSAAVWPKGQFLRRHDLWWRAS